MLRSLSSRRMLPVAALTSVALLLAGCGGDDEPTAKPTDDPTAATTPAVSPDDPCDFESGGVSEKVKVSGDFGKKVTATFDTPLKADGLQRTVVDEGDGEKTKNGDPIDLVSTIYKGSDGKVIAGAGGQALDAVAGQLKVGDKGTPAAYAAGISCVPIGSRVVVTVKASDIIGPEGNEALGIEPDESLVFVTDVVGIVVPLTPDRWTNPPAVKFNGAKTPTVTLPKGKPSPRLLLGVLKAGTGALVGDGDSVTVNYKGINLRTGDVFDESYGRAPATFVTSQVVKGFGAALVGQKVGAKVIVSIPPEFGYGATGNTGAGIKGTDTILFVVEIQSTEPAAQ